MAHSQRPFFACSRGGYAVCRCKVKRICCKKGHAATRVLFLLIFPIADKLKEGELVEIEITPTSSPDSTHRLGRREERSSTLNYMQGGAEVNPSAKFSLPSNTDSQYVAAVESGAAFFLSCLQADGTLYSECFAKKKPPFRYFRTVVSGAGDGNRTHVASLEGWSSTIELHPRLALCYYSNAGCGLSTARCAI